MEIENELLMVYHPVIYLMQHFLLLLINLTYGHKEELKMDSFHWFSESSVVKVLLKRGNDRETERQRGRRDWYFINL